MPGSINLDQKHESDRKFGDVGGCDIRLISGCPLPDVGYVYLVWKD